MDEPTNKSIQPAGRRVIQPEAGFEEELKTEREMEKLSPPIPEVPDLGAKPLPPVTGGTNDPNQRLAIETTRQMAENADKPISLRVKPLLVFSVLMVISSIYGFSVALTQAADNPVNYVTAFVAVIQLAISAYLLMGKDRDKVGLILKIFLILQLVSLFTSLAVPVAFAFNLILTIFLYIVYTKVKTLPSF